MKQNLMKINMHDTFASLKACTCSVALKEGKRIHSEIMENSVEQNEGLISALIDLYAKCGSLSEARNVFDRLKKSFALPWNAMTGGYILYGDAYEVVYLFSQMLKENVRLNHVSFLNALKACSKLLHVEGGKLLHGNIIESGFDLNCPVCNALIDMYLKCGLVDDAYTIFKKLLSRDVVSWNTMISGLSQENSMEALYLFEQMQREGKKPDNYTYASILKACLTSEAADQVRLIHVVAVGDSLELDNIILSSLMDAYAKCGHLQDALKMWERLPRYDVVSYNSLIAGYAQHGHGEEALRLFVRMLEEGNKPNEATLVSVLKGCSCATDTHQVTSIHSLIVRSGFELEVDVGTSLMNSYIKFGKIKQVYKIFDDMALKSVVTWNVLLNGFVQDGRTEDVFGVFQQMLEETEPDNLSFMNLLKACSHKIWLEQGKRVHCYIVENGLGHDDKIGNTLVEMYVKCEDVEDARLVFVQLQKQTIVAWTSMIAGYALQGNYEEVAYLIDAVQKEGLKLDDIAYIYLLSACSRKGLLMDGVKHFTSMLKEHGINPELEHFTCMVDLLSRGGRLTDAEFILKCMPSEFNILGWVSLLNSCKTHGKVEIGRRCFDHIMLIDSSFAPAYTLMSNLYISLGMLEEANGIQEMKKHAQMGSKYFT